MSNIRFKKKVKYSKKKPCSLEIKQFLTLVLFTFPVYVLD